ncbi:PREDICTED: odorant receptor 13a [Bactrocera latifrons]|uniref:odorant receptor 13a n=1 Tax=Bactrocera latifrons TaxID=174628 RepID=UPI0008DC7F95|nr:PREDICTED: odorant receptor 13a [Bactrocera latifrons]
MLCNPKPSKDPKNFRFPLQCIWLKLNGSWPLKPKVTGEFEKYFRLLYSTWAWYVVVMVGITIGFQSAFLLKSFGNIMVTTENGCTTFMGLLNFVRLLHLRLHQRDFQQLLAQFVKDIWITSSSHPTVERACARNMRVFQVISVLQSSLITMYCILPLVELYMLTVNMEPDALDTVPKPFPYKMLFPYDANHGWRYALTYLFTAWAGVCVVTTLFAEDSLFGFFVSYTCGQFRILHTQIDNIIPDSYAATRAGRGTEPVFQRECIRRLDKIANKHCVLFNFVIRMEEFFSPILLVNFLISSVLICMVGFQLVTGQNMFIGDYVKFLVYILSSLSQLFVLCWNGDNIIQNSLEMANHLYACNWESSVKVAADEEKQESFPIVSYSTSAAFRKNLQFMIMRSQRQTCITAMKFSILSLNSFSGLISSSMSYFALLQSFYENEEN